jgi:biopolymer transport protein ExbB
MADKNKISGFGLVSRRIARAALGFVFLAAMTASHSAKAWWDGDWSSRKKITIDAGTKGAALPADAGRIPLLVRLHDGNFKFADAKDDGSDIRFIAGDDKTPLKFHIDTYDGLLGVALIWVDVPSVTVGQATDIWMYWGNPKAIAGGDPKGTYDPDTTLVYHFAEKDAPPADTTANANNATSPAKSIDTGLIGRAAHFDGSAPIMLPASPSLAILQNAQFSWSAWVKPETASTGVLFSKHDGGNALVIGIDQGVPYVSVSSGAAPARGNAAGPITAAAWHHIAVTASDHVTLYIDGKQAATVAGALPALGGTGALGADTAPADTSTPAAQTPNAPAQAAAVPTPPAAGFVGDIDEVEMAKTARSPAFVAAAFASQSPESHMLAFGEDEENSSLSGGYFGVILRSVTIDGWVVIGILGVMFAVAVTVMVNKAIYINRAAKANGPFLDIFTRYGDDIDELRVQMASADDHSMDDSVLYRVYRAADEELERRMEKSGSGYLVLSPQAIATIRANLDRAAQQEIEDLNRFIVLLTIAISGGPFLGLLGTVVGVMITFAAIAASGDVNINAIAPGIAAALVATVAGLGVAIPSLFGYNYLTARIKDLISQMRGFVDELVTRLGETYSARPEKLAAE